MIELIGIEEKKQLEYKINTEKTLTIDKYTTLYLHKKPLQKKLR